MMITPISRIILLKTIYSFSSLKTEPFFNCIHIESKLDSMARSIKLDSVGTSL